MAAAFVALSPAVVAVAKILRTVVGSCGPCFRLLQFVVGSCFVCLAACLCFCVVFVFVAFPVRVWCCVLLAVNVVAAACF